MAELVKMIVVDADGEVITAANGYVSSNNRELIRKVKIAARLQKQIQLVAPHGKLITASLEKDNLVGITAALFSAKPGRTRLLEAPKEVLDWIKEEYSQGKGECRTISPEDEASGFQFRSSDEIVRALLD